MTIFRHENGQSIYTPDRLAEIWPLLDPVLPSTGDARTYYETCSIRDESGNRRLVERSSNELARLLKWSLKRVKKAGEVLTEAIRPFY